MDIFYSCSKCGRSFQDKELCEKHEKECKTNVNIKFFYMSKGYIDCNFDDYIKLNHSEKYIIEKYITNKTKVSNSEVILDDDFITFRICESFLNLNFIDNICSNESVFYLFTYNMSNEYEKEVIQKFKEQKKKELLQIISDVNKNIQLLDTNNIHCIQAE